MNKSYFLQVKLKNIWVDNTTIFQGSNPLDYLKIVRTRSPDYEWRIVLREYRDTVIEENDSSN